MKNKLLTILYIIALTCFALTLSISMPIYCRFFYYLHIDGLNLVETTGFSKEVIKTAYNEMINYLILPWAEFSTGALKYSSSGAEHFKDVKDLFMLNFGVLISSALVTITLTILNKKGVITLVNFKNKSPLLYAGVIALLVPLLIGAFAITDFNTAFTVFHKVFFPGKTNWVFNPKTDQIINVLPVEFFANCAAFIGVTLIVVAIIYFIIAHKQRKKSA